jgi:hypothetical protein
MGGATYLESDIFVKFKPRYVKRILTVILILSILSVVGVSYFAGLRITNARCKGDCRYGDERCQKMCLAQRHCAYQGDE